MTMQSQAPATELSLSNKTIVVAYGQVPIDTPQDEKDILIDVELIGGVLAGLGYKAVPMAIPLNFDKVLADLQQINPLMIFNLVDAIYDQDALLHWPPTLFETYHFPYTGADAKSLYTTTDKLLCKQLLGLAGIATPQWQSCERLLLESPQVLMPCIVKPTRTDASRGIDDSSVCSTPEQLVKKVTSLRPVDRPWFFAEHFIEGREFNVSVMSAADGVRVMPPAEMTFIDYPSDKPTIVDFRAKWVEDSFEYSHTVRRFDFPPADQPLLDELKSIALRCWSLFGLTGYARVDFRVDKTGKPLVLEINGNPCISPDAGFVAAAEKGGFSYEQIIAAIVDDVIRRLRQAGRLAEQRKQRRRALSKKR